MSTMLRPQQPAPPVPARVASSERYVIQSPLLLTPYRVHLMQKHASQTPISRSPTRNGVWWQNSCTPRAADVAEGHVETRASS